jgi:hypothetical protein
MQSPAHVSRAFCLPAVVRRLLSDAQLGQIGTDSVEGRGHLVRRRQTDGLVGVPTGVMASIFVFSLVQSLYRPINETEQDEHCSVGYKVAPATGASFLVS